MSPPPAKEGEARTRHHSSSFFSVEESDYIRATAAKTSASLSHIIRTGAVAEARRTLREALGPHCGGKG